MDTSWIQVFVLTLSECVAPSGKTVCQEREAQYEFVDRAQCEAVLDELVLYKEYDPNTIVNSARCLPTARERQTYVSLDEVNRQLADTENWGILPPGETEPREPSMPEPVEETMTAHQQRLANLPECDEATSVTPCKVGQIIVEGETERELEVWRRDE